MLPGMTGLKVEDRVRTPMPVNAPKGRVRLETQTGTVIEVNGPLVRVRMDGHGLVTTWTADTLTREN